MDISKQWKINAEKEIFECKLFRVIEKDSYLPSKDISNNFISLQMRNWVNVFAVTADSQVIMVEQHRMGQDLVTVEVPAGTVDPEEDPEKAALRELEEETGYVPGKIIHLKTIFVNPALQNNQCSFFLATGCIKSRETHFDPTEDLDCRLYSIEEIFNAPDSEFIQNSVTLLSIMLAKEAMTKNQNLS